MKNHFLTSFLLLALLGESIQKHTQMSFGQLKSLLSSSQQGNHGCKYAINRIKREKNLDWEAIHNQQTPWTDTSFPTNDAIYWTDQGYQTGRLRDFYSSKWVRSFTLNKRVQLYGDMNNLMQEIDQGNVGDCYFLSAMSALGEWNVRLVDIFKTRELNKAGIFSAQFYIRGIRQVISVDDYLAVNLRNQLVFNNQDDLTGSIWGPLMEKVWAKINGNYEFIVAGVSKDVFMALLGCPAEQFSMQRDPVNFNPAKKDLTLQLAAQTAFQLLEQANSNQFVMGCSTGLANNYGLVVGHAYTLIDTAVIKENNKVKNRLYKIRNPWGTDVYTGKWNDNDKLSWTESAKRQVNFVNNTNDGVFYMEDTDFVQAFESFGIAYHYDHYFQNVFDLQNDQKQQIYFKFKLDFPATNIYISVEFYDPRMYPISCRKPAGSVGLISIQTVQGVFIQQNYDLWDNSTSNYLQYDRLGAGEYIASVKMLEWDPQAVNDFTFRVYSAIKVPISVLTAEEGASLFKSQLQETLTEGMANVDDTVSLPYDYFEITRGWNGPFGLIEIVPYKTTCSQLSMNINLVGVDDSISPPVTSSPAICESLGNQKYRCTCDLSAGKQKKCTISYFESGYSTFTKSNKPFKC